MNDEPKQAGERSVHRLLTQTLREETAPDAANCLDAETVAAWMDGVLPADVLAAAEGHAAGCARCQAVLSAMARTAPPVARRSWWPASLTFRFLVPATAAATAVALWIAVAPGVKRPELPVRRAKSIASPAFRRPRWALATRGAAGSSAGGIEQETGREQGIGPIQSARQDAREKSAVEAPDSFETRRDRAEGEKSKTNGWPQRRNRRTRASRRPSAASPARRQPPRRRPASPARRRLQSPPLRRSRGRARSAGPPPISEIAGFRAARTLLTEIASPDRESRWRAGAAGVVHRSTDGGLTWTPQQTGTTANFTAGSSPARDVCWLVGRGGTVLLSVDGTTWQLRPFPEKVDLVAVQATDAKTATVTTSDGRRFSTTDGGATWSRLRRSPLQEFPAAPF